MKKISRTILLLLVMGTCFFFCAGSNVFALFRDDINIEEAEELIGAEKEKGRIRQEEKDAEKEMLKHERVFIAEEKQISSSAAPDEKALLNPNKKIVAGAVIFAIAIIFTGKVLFANKSRRKR